MTFNYLNFSKQINYERKYLELIRNY